jgi:hypothetical protein
MLVSFWFGVSAFGAGYYSLVHSNSPPLPFLPDLNMEVWDLGNDRYLFDDQNQGHSRSESTNAPPAPSWAGGTNYEYVMQVSQYPAVTRIPGPRIWINTNVLSGNPEEISTTIRFHKMDAPPTYVPGTTNKDELTLLKESLLQELLVLSNAPPVDPTNWSTEYPRDTFITNWICVTNWVWIIVTN